MTKCSCCGEEIEGVFTRQILLAVDALNAAIATWKAAGDTRLRAICEPSATTVETLTNLLGQMERHAAVEQKVAIREAMTRALELLRTPQPS